MALYHVAYQYEVIQPGVLPPLAVGFGDSKVDLIYPPSTAADLEEARRLIKLSLSVEFDVSVGQCKVIVLNYWKLH